MKNKLSIDLLFRDYNARSYLTMTIGRKYWSKYRPLGTIGNIFWNTELSLLYKLNGVFLASSNENYPEEISIRDYQVTKEQFKQSMFYKFMGPPSL